MSHSAPLTFNTHWMGRVPYAQAWALQKDYHREMDFVRTYYPQANIHTIDGTRPAADVSKAIEAVLGN